ncbi:hypothetical protein DV515_00019533, partial [Chloebia gouldiae]
MAAKVILVSHWLILSSQNGRQGDPRLSLADSVRPKWPPSHSWSLIGCGRWSKIAAEALLDSDWLLLPGQDGGQEITKMAADDVIKMAAGGGGAPMSLNGSRCTQTYPRHTQVYPRAPRCIPQCPGVSQVYPSHTQAYPGVLRRIPDMPRHVQVRP